jgi:hypothetical protein
VEIFAPPSRMAPGTSHVFADLLLGGWLVLAISLAILFAWRAWSRARKLRAEVWHERGLRPGPILVPGVATPLDDDRTGQPFIELSIEQHGVQRHTKNGHYVAWSETSRALRDRPFLLRCDNGELVRVEPSGRVDLIDRLDQTHRLSHADRRRSARIVEGEPVWIRGELVDTAAGGSGPYRGAAPTHRWLLRPLARDGLFISSEPVEQEGRAEARFHAAFAALYAVMLLLCQGVLFHEYRALRARGVASSALLTSKTTWTTRSKSTVTRHYGFHLQYNGTRSANVETNGRVYRATGEGATVPILYDGDDPDTMQLGSVEELGLGSGSAIFGMVLAVMLTVLYLVFNASRMPWWRRRKLLETESGKL